MAVERTAAEAAAVSQAAAAQAAAAEEALRRFRVSPLIADAQQRLFHAFIASTCAGLNSPPSKRRNRFSLDSAGSPTANCLAGLNSPSPPPAELSPTSPMEPKCLAAAPSGDLPTSKEDTSDDAVEPVPASDMNSWPATGNAQNAEPASAPDQQHVEPSAAAPAPTGDVRGVPRSSRRQAPGGAVPEAPASASEIPRIRGAAAKPTDGSRAGAVELLQSLPPGAPIMQAAVVVLAVTGIEEPKWTLDSEIEEPDLDLKPTTVQILRVQGLRHPCLNWWALVVKQLRV